MAKRKAAEYGGRMPEPQWGDIYIADLGEERKTRPVIVVQNDSGNHFSEHVIVVVITSQIKQFLPTHVYIPTSCGIKKPSTAVCETIVTIDKADLLRRIGTVKNRPQEAQIRAALRASLNLSR